MAIFNVQMISIVIMIALTGLAAAICGGSGLSVRQEIQQAAESAAEELGLSNRGLTSLPPEIGQLTRLRKLRLDDNQLKELPPEIGSLTNLTELYLSYNQLTTLPPEVGQLANLVELDLGNNQLTALPGPIGNLSNLERLLLLNNNALKAVPPKSAGYPT